MSYLQEKLDIEGYFEANWTHTPVVFENGVPDQSSDWVRLSIQNGKAYQASMGDNPQFRYPGVVFVQIFTAKDVGSGRAIDLADKVEELFKNAIINGIQFRVPRVNKVPSNSENYQVNVSTAFYRGS
jgi:hypothetical protein